MPSSVLVFRAMLPYPHAIMFFSYLTDMAVRHRKS
jgi:hypothetical protein